MRTSKGKNPNKWETKSDNSQKGNRGSKRSYDTYRDPKSNTNTTAPRISTAKNVAIKANQIGRPNPVPPLMGPTILQALGTKVYSNNNANLPGGPASVIPSTGSKFATTTVESSIVSYVNDEWYPIVATNSIAYNVYNKTTNTLDHTYPEFDAFRRIMALINTNAATNMMIKFLYFGKPSSTTGSTPIDFSKTFSVKDVSGNETKVSAAYVYTHECNEFAAMLTALIAFVQKLHARANYFAML